MRESLKEWALYYASMGLAVFPLRPKDKRPATVNGCKAATTNKEQIAGWWDKHPDSNIGIATGRLSGGLVVIDLDIDENKGVNGYDSLKAWQRENGELQETWQSITGRGGYHLLYMSASTHKNRVGLYEGIDIRGDGGYIVAPPSIHPNGRKYEWEQGPDEIAIAQADRRVADLLNGTVSKKQEKQDFPPMEKIPEGCRTDAMVRLVGRLKGDGLADESIRAAVRSENEKLCVPPLTERELEKTVFPALSRGWQAERPYAAVTDNGKTRPVKEFKPVKAITAAELGEMDIPPITWLVRDILPVGLSMIGAPSKYFKSYMALGLCLAICRGGKFLGFDCEKHGCLYLDLESTKRRPKSRIEQITGPFDKPPGNLYIITGEQNVGRIGEGFEAQVEHQLAEHPDIKLIVVDVFQLVKKPKGRSQSDYDCDYENFKAIKQIADTHDIGLTLIHHTRKMKDPTDVFNELSGSVGVMGALDCAWVISKDDRYAAEATLHITGRDMEAQKLKIRFNKKKFQWEYIGTEEDIENQRLMFEYEQSPVVATIRKLVNQGGGHWEGSASDLIGASKYFAGCIIYDDSRKVGKLIGKYESYLAGIDGIIYEMKKTSKKNVYIFNSTDSINSINSTDSINSISG